MLIDLDMPLEPFNSYVRDGSAGEWIRKILEDLKPEAVYFSEREGRRGGIMIVDVPSPSDVPRIAEPFLLTFNAAVKFRRQPLTGTPTMRRFQHAILGTGQALGTLLGDLLPTGDSIAVIEGDRIGGTCVNTGCTPTKALVATARVAHMVRRAPQYGIHPNGLEVQFEAVRARMNAIRDNTGLASWISSARNVSLFQDWGQFEGPRRLRVGDETITADRIYINAGARPRVPEIPGLGNVPWLDHGRLLDLTEVPEHLIILGGSYIGLEFGQIFRRFGARVTIIEQGSQLVFREDADIAASIRGDPGVGGRRYQPELENHECFLRGNRHYG